MTWEDKRLEFTYREKGLRVFPRFLSDAEMRKYEEYLEGVPQLTADQRRRAMRTLKRMAGMDDADDMAPIVEELRHLTAEMMADKLHETKSAELVSGLVAAAATILASSTGQFILEKIASWFTSARAVERNIETEVQDLKQKLEQAEEARRALEAEKERMQTAQREAEAENEDGDETPRRRREARRSDHRPLDTKSPGAHSIYR